MRNISFFIGTSVIISTILCLSCPNTLYHYNALLPPIFAAEAMVLRAAHKKKSNSITIGIIALFLWVRMVFIPLMGSTDANYYHVCTSDSTSLITAISLCVYESLVVILTTYLVAQHKSRNSHFNNPILLGNKYIYLIFGVFALVVFLVLGRHLHIFEFAIKSIGAGERAEETLDATTLLIRQIVGSGLLFYFFFLIENFRRKNKQTSNTRYITFAILAAMFMVCLITGERRTSQIYTAFCTSWLLIHVFPFAKKKVLRAIITTAAFVLTTMTIYKHFNAYLYDTYAEALDQADFNQGFSATMFDAYFYGINTIIKNIDFGSIINLSPLHFIYDTARCTFGLNFIIPRDIRLTSELYNLYLYGGEQDHGYLLSSVGYGYIYFGFILAPFFSVINIVLLSFFERKMRNAPSIEMTYIWAFVFMRFGFGFLGSIPPLISLVTRYLFFNGLLYLFAKSLKTR